MIMADFFSVVLILLVCAFFLYSVVSFVRWIIDRKNSKKDVKKDK